MVNEKNRIASFFMARISEIIGLQQVIIVVIRVSMKPIPLRGTLADESSSLFFNKIRLDFVMRYINKEYKKYAANKVKYEQF
ncbi:hypothetical protein J7E26_16435 [Bacillus sp. ISL-51]|nr:hypothetical protein [Bacillus sp. ISL-51]